MRKKEVSKRWQSIAEVRASLGVHRAHIGDKLDQRAEAQSVEAFSYQPFFDHTDGELARVQRQLVTAEDDHVRQLVRLVGLRRQTRDLAAGVYDKQVAARRILSGLYGDDRKFELAAIEGATPQAAQVLAEQVDQTVNLLLDPGAAVPTAIVCRASRWTSLLWPRISNPKRRGCWLRVKSFSGRAKRSMELGS